MARCIPAWLPPPLLAAWIDHHRDEELALAQGLDGNAALAELLAANGIEALVHGPEGLPAPWLWETASGARLRVGSQAQSNATAQPLVDEAELPLQRGELELPGPALAPVPAPALGLLVERAREMEVEGLGQDGGCDWPGLLTAAIEGGTAPPAPSPPSEGWQCGNSLPWARPTPVQWPLGSRQAPWGLIDAGGRRHPVQVVEGPLGRMALAVPFLPAAGGCQLTTEADPVPAGHWEVSPQVIDNGLLRAELDEQGLIHRLLIDGRFQHLAGPMLQPVLDGLPLSGQAQVTVLESGPVRARITTTLQTPQGILHLDYSLLLGEHQLRIGANWQGGAFTSQSAGRAQARALAPELELHSAWTSGLLRLGALGDGRCVQAGSGLQRPERRAWLGWNWACLGADDGSEGLLLVLPRPQALALDRGRLRLPLTGTLHCALADGAAASRRRLHPQRRVLELATPGCLRSFLSPRCLQRQDDEQGVVPWWCASDGRGAILLALAECNGARASCLLPGPESGGAAAVSLVDRRGQVLRTLRHEAEGWRLQLRPWQLVWLRLEP